MRYRLGDVAFVERFGLPAPARDGAHGASFEHAVDVLHLCAGTSYYKAAAPPVLVPPVVVPLPGTPVSLPATTPKPVAVVAPVPAGPAARGLCNLRVAFCQDADAGQ